MVYKVRYNVGKKGRFTSNKTFLTKRSANKFVKEIKDGKKKDWYKQAKNVAVVKK